ncbi:MAG TPA: IclR family transcriptional regulator [Acidimicrobiia bacterium]|jgi:DNA-binding IclR family transcriptional regulator|nr:IclR family transcriptional regulator [Acidimicrobiia bacterium]
MADDRQLLSSVRNAARLLKQFSSREREFGVSELARRLRLGKSTVHRLVSTLTAEHLLEQNPDNGKYRLGLAVYDLGAAVATHLDLHEAVVPPMERLRNATGETVQVAVLDGREVVYVERLDSPHTLRLFLDVGRRNWAHCTATGKCLLAYASDYDLDRILDGWPLPKLTAETVTDAQRLRKELATIRRRGYAQNLNESEMGVLSVAAPIRDVHGGVSAAMSVAGPSARMDPILGKITAAVVESAALASRRLGYRR